MVRSKDQPLKTNQSYIMLVTSGETVPDDNSDQAQTYAEFVTVNTGVGNRATITG